MYHTMCTLMIENISTDNVYSRRLCSARPSHVVDKFCSKKALTRRNSTKKVCLNLNFQKILFKNSLELCGCTANISSEVALSCRSRAKLVQPTHNGSWLQRISLASQNVLLVMQLFGRERTNPQLQ
mmetsp:Transcript_38262/g.49348  ORF Transcript_38262/g.49348 Transcript_38262/m.49348 type:complete len:126 (-) Transcript_38262:696-1073(-)